MAELRKRLVEYERPEWNEAKARCAEDPVCGAAGPAEPEWSFNLSEVIEALERISSGDPTVRIDEASDDVMIKELKRMVNLTARGMGEMVDLSHEFAMGLAEHFDVLHRVSRGDLNAKVSGTSPIELLESLKKVTNQMILSIETKNRERDETEKMLRNMEALETSILSTIPHAVIGLHERNIIFANESINAVFGWTPQELIGKSTRILYRTDEEYEEIGRLFYPALSKQRTFTHEFMCRRKDGSDFFCGVSASVIGERLDEKRIVVIYEDKTQTRHAEEALQESERKLRYIVEHSNELFYIHNTGHEFTYISPQSLPILGYPPEELMIEWTMLTTENPLNEKAYELTEMALKTGERQKPYLVEVYRKDGGKVLLEVDESPLKGCGGEVIGIVGAARDVTELKRTEAEKEKLHAQLLHAQKMEAIGRLAGGISHDFNNILTAIIGYAHFIKMKTKENEQLRVYAENILSLSDRATCLTQGLLALSRKQVINLRPVNVNEIIRSVDSLLMRIIGEDIELKTKLTDRKVTIMADMGQMEQVLMNLATNSRDAMPGGGLLFIETDVVDLDSNFIKTHGFGNPGRYVLISETDTGTGMDKETKGKIFEPFFTTKEVGKGTGLGLSIVYGIVKQHDGYITAYSEPGIGTTFNIYLPLVKSQLEKESPEAMPSPAAGKETLLLAEDDKEVRAFTKEILTEYGYAVVEASDGEDAVKKFTEHKDAIELLLLDIIMPKKNGKEAYEQIKKVKPGIKALFISGYTADVIHEKGIVGEGLNFIMKPISPMILTKKVRDILEV